ncbi:unnamed protein product [Paramecium octaurelia]|uniref:Uncharacterized protein n=1 Tax=Paramecium octaurelia TaxID=43137 RepID=A0A8S1V343_PAROT|nr:unnamed protein product [Paramecium octaurelia]
MLLCRQNAFGIQLQLALKPLVKHYQVLIIVRYQDQDWITECQDYSTDCTLVFDGSKCQDLKLTCKQYAGSTLNCTRTATSKCYLKGSICMTILNVVSDCAKITGTAGTITYSLITEDAVPIKQEVAVYNNMLSVQDTQHWLQIMLNAKQRFEKILPFPQMLYVNKLMINTQQMEQIVSKEEYASKLQVKLNLFYLQQVSNVNEYQLFLMDQMQQLLLLIVILQFESITSEFACADYFTNRTTNIGG